ncbi:MAG TPA: hypothetical protein VFC94_01710 [Bacteroidaceae bacterium]|nr:hypothetical protein [Bacteroidaceae bacterium]
MRKKILWLILTLIFYVIPLTGYAALYKVNGDEIKVDSLNFLLFSQMVDNDTLGEFCFYSLKEALSSVRDGSETSPMTIYLLPGIYSLDDTPETTICCNWLKLTGVTDSPEQVVVTRTIKKNEDKPLLKVEGVGFEASNITFRTVVKQNENNIKKKLLSVNGDKGLFRNCHFQGIMSESPVNEGMRMLYDNCFFECTEFSLNGFSVYMNCSFNLLGEEPLFNVPGTGVVFLNCDFTLQKAKKKYLALNGGQIVLVDCNFSGNCESVEWAKNSHGSLRCYQSGVTLNNKPYILNSNDSSMTIEMEGMPLLNAYKYMYGGNTIYNVFNLLSDNDGWDPAEQIGVITAANNFYGKEFSGLPVYMNVSPDRAELRKGDAPINLVAKPFLRNGTISNLDFIGWSISNNQEQFIEFKVPVTEQCHIFAVQSRVESGNRESIVVSAVSDYGLESASVLDLIPLIDNLKIIPDTKKERRGLFGIFKMRDKKRDI